MGRLKNYILAADSQTKKTSEGPLCALAIGKTETERKGYRVVAEGPYLKALVGDHFKECQACFGSGRRQTGVASRSCHEPNPNRIVNLYADAKIPALYVGAEIDRFTNHSGNGRMAVQKIKKWLQEFGKGQTSGLVLSGPVGVGKTYLLAAIAKEMIESGRHVKFIDFHRLLSVIRAAYSDRVSEESILGPLIDAEVLFIDELGKGRNNDWEQEKLDQIVMGRYNQNKPIVASTNYGVDGKSDSNKNLFYNVKLDEMSSPRNNSFNPDVFENLESRIGKRIFSRLYEMSLMIDLTGEDFRRRKKSKNEEGMAL